MKRKNPVRTIRKHPDLFEGETPVVFSDWRDVETWRLEDMTDDYIDEESLEEIRIEEPEVYKAIMLNTRHAREERIKPMVDLINRYAKWAREEAASSERDDEIDVDYFTYQMQNMSVVGFIKAIGDDELEALAESFDSDQVLQVLQDPSNWELFAGEDKKPEFVVDEHVISATDLYIPGVNEDEDFHEAFMKLRDKDDLQAVKDSLEGEPYWLDVPPDFKWSYIEEGGSFNFNVDIEEFTLYWGTDDLDSLKEEISNLRIQPSKLEGPEHDNIVYRFPDGFYVAELRANQLPAEGRRQGMCVGRADMGYIQNVIEGSTAIYSLRSPSGKPKLTFEVDLDLPVSIDQVKGKGNRLPGFAYDDHETLRRPDEVRKAVEFINHYLWFKHAAEDYSLPGKLSLMADEVDDLKPAMEVIGYDYDDEGRAVLEPETTRWKIEMSGDKYLVEEVLSKGVDPSGIFNTKGQALHHIRTVLQPEAESVAEQGAYVRFYAVPVRENPEAAIPVPPDVQALAEEAFEHPWGGEW